MDDYKAKKYQGQRDFIGAVLKANLLSALSAGKGAYIPIIFMFIQNMLFMMIWVLFFSYADNIYGWTLREMMALSAMVCFSFGMASVFCGGAYTLNHIVDSGALDNFLCRPGDVLISAIFSHSRVAGLGDILTGLVLMAYVAGTNVAEWGMFFACVGATSILLASMIIIVQSIGFWKSNSGSLSDSLFEFIVILSSMPQHGFPLAAKVFIFTVLPVGFMGLLPVTIFTTFNVALLVPLYGATFVFALIARLIFFKGLEQYKSGNAFM
jgi:ABC-2 type transport system permease protein